MLFRPTLCYVGLCSGDPCINNTFGCHFSLQEFNNLQGPEPNIDTSVPTSITRTSDTQEEEKTATTTLHNNKSTSTIDVAAAAEVSSVPASMPCNMDTSPSASPSHTSSARGLDEEGPTTGKKPSRPSPGVMQCIKALQDAADDNQKFAALMLVTKLIKAESLDTKSMAKLFEAIGLEFLIKLLRDDSPSSDCPSFILKSISLSIFSSFMATGHRKSMIYDIIPDLLTIISDPELLDNNLVVVQDAFQCLNAIALHKQGRNNIVECYGLENLVNLYVRENFCQELALKLIIDIVSIEGGVENAWQYCLESFTKLASHMCSEFNGTQSERKFDLCSPLVDVLCSMPDSIPDDDGYEWQKQLHKGLCDILMSKLDKEHRKQGLYLASAALDNMGATWMIAAGPKGHQLLLIMVHLACVEVRMSLENEDRATAIGPHTTSCYSILENAIKFLVKGAMELQEKQKQQLYSALKGAFDAVMFFLQEISQGTIDTEDQQSQMFVCATIRVLGAWLAEETSANKQDVYSLLPFLIGRAKYNFEWNKKISRSIDTKKHQKSSKSIAEESVSELPDLLRFLLPGLCHLSAEDEPRHTLLELDADNLLLEYFSDKYDLLAYLNGPKSVKEARMMSIASVDSVCDTVVTLCSIFMNIVVTAPQIVQKKPLYLQLLKSILIKVPEIPISSLFLPLTGNMCVLGLMILRHQIGNIRNSESGIFRFVQSTIRFLWDAHNVEESTDHATLVVCTTYLRQWSDLMELWYLGMHNLIMLVSQSSGIPWLCDFLLECEWPQNVVQTISRVRANGIEPELKASFEELLCVIVRGSPAAKRALQDCDVLAAATTHQMTQLVTDMTR